MTKRCFVCDSTEYYDTIIASGINTPIEYWMKDNLGHDLCNRCHNTIQEALVDYNLSIDNELKDSTIIVTNKKIVTKESWEINDEEIPFDEEDI